MKESRFQTLQRLFDNQKYFKMICGAGNEDLEEVTATANVDGYSTPHAFSTDKDEEKKFKKMAVKVLESSPEEALQTKIIKLLDKQLEILEEEVNALKFKMSHNKLSEDDLQLIYDSLIGVMPEMED